MPKRDQLRRLNFIHAQIQAGKYPSAQSLAVELECKPRVIWNDREYMRREFGAPIKLDRNKGGWYYSEPTFILPTTIVTEGELFAFLMATEAARHPLNPETQQVLLTAVEKIAQSLQGTVSIDLDELRRHIAFAVPLSTPTSLETVLTLRQSIERQRQVAMTYFTASRGESKRRVVEPHLIYKVDADHYLIAFDPHKAKMLTFHIARIRDLDLRDQTFPRQPNFNPKHFTQSGFRAESGPKIYPIEIQFTPTQAPYIKEKTWHESQSIEESTDGTLILKFESSGLGQICRWVMQYGPQAKVLAPPELKEMVAEQVREMGRIYGENQK